MAGKSVISARWFGLSSFPGGGPARSAAARINGPSAFAAAVKLHFSNMLQLSAV